VPYDVLGVAAGGWPSAVTSARSSGVRRTSLGGDAPRKVLVRSGAEEAAEAEGDPRAGVDGTAGRLLAGGSGAGAEREVMAGGNAGEYSGTEDFVAGGSPAFRAWRARGFVCALCFLIAEWVSTAWVAMAGVASLRRLGAASPSVATGAGVSVVVAATGDGEAPLSGAMR
jgi:hypothetical protein